MSQETENMLLKTLDAEYLHGAILQACFAVVAQREHLNTINIFPVADGDTGDNMAATAMAVIRFSVKKSMLSETLQSVAEAGILGARGNSGMIFSQFFNGLVDNAPNKVNMTTQEFADVLKGAALSVRQAILHPVEGTLLTLVEAWAEAVGEKAPHEPCFNQLLSAIHPKMKASLEETSKKISVLEQAHVVDAGALGFYHFTEAFKDYLAHPRALPESAEEMLCCEHHDHDLPKADAPPHYRYCTEALINVKNIDKSALGACLETDGDSVVLTANQRICRFHVHTSTPWTVFNKIRAFGVIEQPKVDDMLRQYEMLHTRKYPIALVVDSCADLPQEYIDTHQIHVIPVNLFMDGHHLLDKFCLQNETLYEELANQKVYPTTSLPTLTMIEAKFRQLSANYEHVVVLSVAKVLSGTHDTFVRAARPFQNIHVVNSKAAAGAQGLLARYATNLIAQGDNIDVIIQKMEEKTSKTGQFVVIEQFDSLIRSGRVPKLAGKIAQLSGIKPILAFDAEGKGIVYDKAFSRIKALNKLIHIVQEKSKETQLEEYCIIHAGILNKAKEFATMAESALGQAPAFMACVSSAVGLHAGFGSLSIAAIYR